jgi:hypothetical protein
VDEWQARFDSTWEFLAVNRSIRTSSQLPGTAPQAHRNERGTAGNQGETSRAR